MDVDATTVLTITDMPIELHVASYVLEYMRVTSRSQEAQMMRDNMELSRRPVANGKPHRTGTPRGGSP